MVGCDTFVSSSRPRTGTSLRLRRRVWALESGCGAEGVDRYIPRYLQLWTSVISTLIQMDVDYLSIIPPLIRLLFLGYPTVIVGCPIIIFGLIFNCADTYHARILLETAIPAKLKFCWFKLFWQMILGNRT